MIAVGPIGRDPAQRLARDELSRAIYHRQSAPQAIAHFISSLLAKVFDGISQVTPGGGWTVVALVALVVIIVGVIVARIGPLAPSARRSVPLLDAGTRPLTARQLRDASAGSAAEGDYSNAILQRLRAIATSLEERGVLPPDAGRTADELAAQAGRLFPARGGDLAVAARLFDQVRYGDGTGTPDGYERLRALDDALTRLSPAGAATPMATAAGAPA